MKLCEVCQATLSKKGYESRAFFEKRRTCGYACSRKMVGPAISYALTGAKGTPEERFWRKVDKRGPRMRSDLTPCWLWIGSRQGMGHGLFRPAGKLVKAHRYALELSLGRALAPGLCALHHCDNPPCVNPEHIYEGTKRDNARDRDLRGRAAPMPSRWRKRAA